MARPRKEKSRDFRLTARYTEDERNSLTQAAQLAGVTLSDFLRAASLSKPLPPPRPKRANRPTVKNGQELSALLLAVGRIGNNVNQLAHCANAGLWPESAALHEARADILWMRQKLMLALGVREPSRPEQKPKPE